MRVGKARRRLNKWYRYAYNTGSVCTNRQLGGYHQGHLKAYTDYMYAKRWSPIGIRSPWVVTPPTDAFYRQEEC